jgi:hypothetical protein
MSEKNATASERDRDQTLELVDLPASDAAHPDEVRGGKATPKLLESAVKGQVFKKVEIHGTA